MIKKKLIIGTANFGKKYGLAGSRVNSKVLSKIFRYIECHKLNYFDMATLYNNNLRIANNFNSGSKINLKIKPDSKWANFNYMYRKLKDQNIDKKITINSVMFHDAKFLFTKDGEIVLKNLMILKKKNFFKKIGISIYDFSDLGFILKKFKINIIQCPFNILDRRLIDYKWLKILKSKKIEVHVRSVFFQGLLTNEKLTKNKYFKRWRPKFNKWFRDISKNDFSATDVCLSYVLKYKVDKIVVGINDQNQLDSIINFQKVKNLNDFNYIKNDNIDLYDTRKWLHLWLNEKKV